MITPIIRGGLVWFVALDNVKSGEPMICYTEQYAPYCRIDHGGL